ncbi:unnamed protein product [Dracunculus medinensis]|uniref:MBF1 domain-containing protein n=1 Tax=Dracunculus medinensis TaxID=318479 RepID=A0A0N4U205_DRAME|nr:unnamed protein product [Dracunculus medinensis]
MCNGNHLDVMNDWEIGGTQNRWVCPSDRHLQLRAQQLRLKSGWSVRTAIVRSPTSVKQQNGNISEAEQEHIRAVLAKAEAGKIREQFRIGLAPFYCFFSCDFIIFNSNWFNS